MNMNLTEAYYEQKFETAFLRAKAGEFQTFFERLMGLAYKADFMPCRPWGKQGDRKNDGYLKSERRLFQVYAPNEMSSSKAKAKICEDFEGAKQHWKEYFDRWVFVHNASDGLPPHVQDLLLGLEKVNINIAIDTWSLEELRLIFRKLTADDKATWFGLAPTEETKLRLGFDELRIVLENIATLTAPLRTEVKDVPAGKIQANALSDATERLLRAGMTKSQLVADFFSQWHDETFGERLAKSFKDKYQQLRNAHTPNQTFAELQSWAGGSQRGTPEHEMAVLTVMAYYFERCDIFEEPRGTPR
ncbi:MAG: hypothetical protein LBU75_05890 [Desulfovibrio sp.]|jgi:hypothetical protein|nr:hypothetical protein [Desulfovibrio sp.]